jgi:hypothetical protein
LNSLRYDVVLGNERIYSNNRVVESPDCMMTNSRIHAENMKRFASSLQMSLDPIAEYIG